MDGLFSQVIPVEVIGRGDLLFFSLFSIVLFVPSGLFVLGLTRFEVGVVCGTGFHLLNFFDVLKGSEIVKYMERLISN